MKEKENIEVNEQDVHQFEENGGGGSSTSAKDNGKRWSIGVIVTLVVAAIAIALVAVFC